MIIFNTISSNAYIQHAYNMNTMVDNNNDFVLSFSEDGHVSGNCFIVEFYYYIMMDQTQDSYLDIISFYSVDIPIKFQQKSN